MVGLRLLTKLLCGRFAKQHRLYYNKNDIFERKAVCRLDVQVGDVIQTKKPHPCGANRFDVLRVGMDFKIKCQGCGHEIMLPRAKIERNIKKVLRAGEQ